jgi:hypothetical protein
MRSKALGRGGEDLNQATALPVNHADNLFQSPGTYRISGEIDEVAINALVQTEDTFGPITDEQALELIKPLKRVILKGNVSSPELIQKLQFRASELHNNYEDNQASAILHFLDLLVSGQRR